MDKWKIFVLLYVGEKNGLDNPWQNLLQSRFDTTTMSSPSDSAAAMETSKDMSPSPNEASLLGLANEAARSTTQPATKKRSDTMSDDPDELPQLKRVRRDGQLKTDMNDSAEPISDPDVEFITKNENEAKLLDAYPDLKDCDSDENYKHLEHPIVAECRKLLFENFPKLVTQFGKLFHVCIIFVSEFTHNWCCFHLQRR